MSRAATTMLDAVTAKIRKIRDKYEKNGFEVIERPGPEHFPFDIGGFARHPPAVLARRGEENHVFEMRDEVRATGPLVDHAGEFRKNPNWHFYLTSCEDVVPADAPGNVGEPPGWPHLERTAAETFREVRSAAPTVQLLGLWAALEGVLRRIAVDDGIAVDLLSAPSLVEMLCERGLIPRESREPLMDAHEVHRAVRHGFGVPGEDVSQAVRTVSAWFPEFIPVSIERAA